MDEVVDAVVRGLGSAYRDGTPRLEIWVPIAAAGGLPLVTGARVPVRLMIGGVEYVAGLRSTPNNPVAWVSPDLVGPGGEQTDLGHVLPAAGFQANDLLWLAVAGGVVTVHPAGG